MLLGLDHQRGNHQTKKTGAAKHRGLGQMGVKVQGQKVDMSNMKAPV